MQALGHPILGDTLYADPATREAAPRLLLHATALSLTHPVSAERLEFVSETPF
jgi:tRNA pseudouridine32 synthase/23S rRNA pseudouridine746 synthase